jgi:transposase
LEADVALKVVTMAGLRFDVLFEPKRSGETVADVYRRYGISRDTYYRYRRRYLAEGIKGLDDRSRKPKTSPSQIPAEVELRIVEMRMAHPRWGARRIRAELEREGIGAPAVSTVHQALRRNGLVAAQPQRKGEIERATHQVKSWSNTTTAQTVLDHSPRYALRSQGVTTTLWRASVMVSSIGESSLHMRRALWRLLSGVLRNDSVMNFLGVTG